MSAPFKFKLKVKTGGDAGAAPSSAAPPSAGGAPDDSQQWPAPAPAPSGSLAPAASKPFKLKLKGFGGAPAAEAAPAAQPPAAQQPPAPAYDAAQAWAAPQPPAAQAEPAEAAPFRPATGAGGPRAIKKIKLATGARPAGAPASAAAPPLPKKPIIKFKPPPKQPRDAAQAAAVEAAAAAEGPPAAAPPPLARSGTLPVVRLTLPVVGGAPAGAPRRLKSFKGPKPKAGGGGGGGFGGGGGHKKKALRPKAARPAPDGPAAAAAKRPKRSRADMKELRDLGVEDLDELSDEFDAADFEIVPRSFTLRSTAAAAAAAAVAAAPSSTGVGLSAGGPAPSDARTGVSGGAAAADTAGTEERPAPRPARGQGERPSLPPLPAGPVAPPRKEDFERLLGRCQKKDVHSMFKEPVTEAIAPGYFDVIKQPMDFATMKAKAGKGAYATWEDLRADMRLMFQNALTYNAEGGNVWNYAKLLMGQCDRIVELAMQGKTDFRSSATITRQHNAAVREKAKKEREQLRAQARAEQRAAQEAKVLKKAGLSSSYDEGEDEAIRGSYRRPVRDGNVARFRGLGGGASAEGVPWGPGREVLRPVNPWLPPGMYAQSLARFAANLRGRAREMVLQRARASTAADEAAERALQRELAKKMPVPPPPPAPAAHAAGMRPGGAAALGAAAAAAGGAGAAPAAMLAQQQQLMQAGARPAGMMAVPAGMRPTGAGALPPGATITFMPTASGMVPFLIQPGQPPVMLMMQGGAAGQKAGGPGMPGMVMQPGMQGMAPGAMLQQPFQPGAFPGMQPRPQQ